jgi:hypothetical protein
MLQNIYESKRAVNERHLLTEDWACRRGRRLSAA